MADSNIALAFIGPLIPDEPRFHGPAFSRAGQMFQKDLIRGLTHAGLAPSVIYGIEPTAAFPRSRKLFAGYHRVEVDELRVRLLPYLNVQPLKPITAGLSALTALLLWGWRHRGRRKLVHCVNLTMPPGPFLLLAARLIGAKATVSVLEVVEPGGIVPDRFFNRLDFWMTRRTMPRFDGHMVASQAIGDDFIPGRPVCRIEGGIQPGDFLTSPAPRSQPLNGQPFRVVLSGALVPYNGVLLALDAFELIPEGFELIIAGTGPLEAVVRARAERNPKIVFKGFMEVPDLLDLYRHADLLINPRLTKSINTRHFYPSKMMQFLASGTATLSTCTGHTEEEFGEFVYLLREETPQALADLVRRVAAAPAGERADMGRRAREYMLSNKTWDRQGERLVHYLKHQVFGDAT